MPLASGTLPANNSRIKAAATTNATSLKTSAGQVFKLTLYNNAAYAVFLKLYDKASAPTVGTDVPKVTIGIPATATGGSRDIDLDGLGFALGIAYAITKVVTDADTTVVVADDLHGLIQWV